MGEGAVDLPLARFFHFPLQTFVLLWTMINFSDRLRLFQTCNWCRKKRFHIIPCNFATCLIFCLVEPFIYKFENASVSEGEVAYIHCFSRGDPPPGILLFKGVDTNAIRTEHTVNSFYYLFPCLSSNIWYWIFHYICISINLTDLTKFFMIICMCLILLFNQTLLLLIIIIIIWILGHIAFYITSSQLSVMWSACWMSNWFQSSALSSHSLIIVITIALCIVMEADVMSWWNKYTLLIDLYCYHLLSYWLCYICWWSVLIIICICPEYFLCASALA